MGIEIEAEALLVFEGWVRKKMAQAGEREGVGCVLFWCKISTFFLIKCCCALILSSSSSSSSCWVGLCLPFVTFFLAFSDASKNKKFHRPISICSRQFMNLLLILFQFHNNGFFCQNYSLPLFLFVKETVEVNVKIKNIKELILVLYQRIT